MSLPVSSIQFTAAPRRILVTGATGFLGGAVTLRLLELGHVEGLSFLVRASTPAEGLERLLQNLRVHDIDERLAALLKPEQILCGDLLDTHWIDAAKPLLQTLDEVINCAAVASFSRNPKIWPVNVEGTFALAEACAQSRRLKRFLHVSTAMACGPQRQSPVAETWDFPEPDQQLVDYTASKAAIELKLRNELPLLPLVVARPSIVVGHRRSGCKASGSIFWVFRMGFALERFTCGLDEQIDVIPVDYCAEALVELALKPKLNYSLYHISAGNAGACTFGEIDEAYAGAMGDAPVGERYRQVDSADLKELAADFNERIGPANPRLVLRALKLYGGFADLNYLFDNQRLLDEGIAAPPRFTDYLDVCVHSSRDISIPAQMQWDFK